MATIAGHRRVDPRRQEVEINAHQKSVMSGEIALLSKHLKFRKVLFLKNQDLKLHWIEELDIIYEIPALNIVLDSLGKLLPKFGHFSLETFEFVFSLF